MKFHPHQASLGFTLVELLVVAAIGSLVLGAISAVATSTIRSSLNSEILQRSTNQLGRVNGIIEADISEAGSVDNGTTPALQTGRPLTNCSISGNSVLTINIPDYTVSPAVSWQIHYFNTPTETSSTSSTTTNTDSSNTLWRCGPAINQLGQLINPGSSPITSIVSPHARIDTVTVTGTPASAATYSITIFSPSGNTVQRGPSQTTVRIRSGQVTS